MHFSSRNFQTDSQTRMKETRGGRKELILSIISFTNCSISVESLSCNKSGGVEAFLISEFSFIRVSYPSSTVTNNSQVVDSQVFHS